MAKTAAALKVAIDLVHVPSRLRLVRTSPLPDDVHLLLRIASGDAEAETAALEQSERTRDTVRAATAFFIEQVLLDPAADSYRVLGANRQTPMSELRRNMALLLTWLHPDKNAHGSRAALAERVTHAWNDLKTGERRAAYDSSRLGNGAPKSMKGDGGVWHRQVHQSADRQGHRPGRTMKPRRRDHQGALQRFLSFFLHRTED